MYAFTDKTDIVSRSGIYGNYAYHAQLSENSVLSFGVGAGYVNNAFDMASVRVKNEGDPLPISRQPKRYAGHDLGRKPPRF